MKTNIVSRNNISISTTMNLLTRFWSHGIRCAIPPAMNQNLVKGFFINHIIRIYAKTNEIEVENNSNVSMLIF